ncbi:hypothetical protein ACP2W0_18010 [Pseudobacillus badius]|uniref:hypothetical protein n=1 Tax=Bacillus badius TaxID=1455 RepID=UPI003CF697AE
MFSWRITKYNPENRDEGGSYLDDKEWTCFSEVGTKVSEEEYVRTEMDYINAITSFMEEMGLNKVYLNDLEIWSDEVVSQSSASFLQKMWTGKAVTLQEIRELAKLTLRNVIWCKLSYKKEFFVHFGYDYYMYIGAMKDCPSARKKIQATGLYVENVNSPY